MACLDSCNHMIGCNRCERRHKNNTDFNLRSNMDTGLKKTLEKLFFFSVEIFQPSTIRKDRIIRQFICKCTSISDSSLKRGESSEVWLTPKSTRELFTLAVWLFERWEGRQRAQRGGVLSLNRQNGRHRPPWFLSPPTTKDLGNASLT